MTSEIKAYDGWAIVELMHRTTGPQDRKALNDWILEHHASDDEKNAFLRALPELKTGDAFVWAPDFLEDKPLGLQRVRILACDTFNSHATPKVGEKRVEPKELTPVDLARLSKAMSATVEKARQDDPAELRRTIATLRKELAAVNTAKPTPAKSETKTVYALKEGQLARLERLAVELDKIGEKFGSTFSEFHHTVIDVFTQLQLVRNAPPSSSGDPRGRSAGSTDGGAVRAGADGRTATRTREVARATGGNPERGPARTTEAISGPQQKMLDALAWLDSVGAPGARWSVLAFLSGQSPKSSGFEKNVSTLRSAGLIQGNGKTSPFNLTTAGQPLANWPATPATSEELHRAIYAKISTPQERMLRALIAAYPRNLTWDELAERGEQSPNSSGFEKNVSTLKSYGLIEGQRAYGFVALSHLFLEERVA